MRLLLLGLLLLVPSALGFIVLVMRGAESFLVYICAASMYVGFGLTLYAIVILWNPDD
jgi:hypothetical protein